MLSCSLTLAGSGWIWCDNRQVSIDSALFDQSNDAKSSLVTRNNLRFEMFHKGLRTAMYEFLKINRWDSTGLKLWARNNKILSACVVPTVKHGEGGVMVSGCFAGDTVVIYLEFKAHLTTMATTAFCSNTPSHLVCA